jgi:mono/diheme cytochrome c family protein
MVVRIAALTLAMAATAKAQPGSPSELEQAAKLFGLRGQACSACHSIGKGDKTGPDLKGLTKRRERAWVERFVKAPGEAIASGDPVAVELFQKFRGVVMDNKTLSAEEFGNLWAYWAHCDALGEPCNPDKWGTDATEEEIALGKALFRGAKPLQNGGPSCLGCHNVRGASVWGGGSVGADLTFAYARMGEIGLVPALEEMSSPVMKALYKNAPLTEDEQYQIKAYLTDVARDGTKPPPTATNFLYLGLEGVGILVGLALILLNRKRANP